MSVDQLIEQYRGKIGEEIAVGAWMEVSQERIDRFAEVTGDVQWIHVDPERASRESPFGTTIAHGFLTLSLLPHLTGSNTPEYLAKHFPGISRRLNYGLDRVRFPAPVPSGSRIRARTKIQDVEKAGEGMEIVFLYTVEVEGGGKPACVAEQIFRLYP